MVIRTGPSPLCWLVGVELARYRRAARMSLTDISATVGISKPKLGHLETGRQQPDPADIAVLLTAYGAGQSDIERLTSLLGRADEATWWMPWAQVVPDWFKTFVGLEGLAAREFAFEPMVIPGLLQTEDYARAVTTGAPRVRPDHSERLVAFRMARARRLDRARAGAGALHLHAVLGEAALRLRVGTDAVHRAQLAHLVAMAERPNITIQVISPDSGPHSALGGRFVILEFDAVQPIGYVELYDSAVYMQDHHQLGTYRMAMQGLQRVAFDPEASVALIRSLGT